MNPHYYLRCGRQITGPFSEQQIREKFRTGQLTEQSEISPDKQCWKPLCRTPVQRTVQPVAVPADDGAAEIPLAEPCGSSGIPAEYPAELPGPVPESAACVIGCTLQMMWDSRCMLTFAAAAFHPRKNILMVGTAAGFLLLLTVCFAASMNAVLHRGGDMWFGSILVMLTLLAVTSCEETLLHVFRSSESVFAEILLLECTGAGAVPLLLFSAGRPLLVQTGAVLTAALWEGAVLASAAFFTVQLVTGLYRVLTRVYGFSVRTAAALTAGALAQQWILVWMATQMLK